MQSIATHGTSSIPADGVEFELTLNAIPDPMQMVRDASHNSTNWKHKGSQPARLTGTFKLVRVGYCQGLEQVLGKLRTQGRNPEGHWREAFNETFPENDGNGPIGVADPSWFNEREIAFFPALSGDEEEWKSLLRWIDSELVADWRWLMQVN